MTTSFRGGSCAKWFLQVMDRDGQKLIKNSEMSGEDSSCVSLLA